jgi:hypothetical protein
MSFCQSDFGHYTPNRFLHNQTLWGLTPCYPAQSYSQRERLSRKLCDGVDSKVTRLDNCPWTGLFRAATKRFREGPTIRVIARFRRRASSWKASAGSISGARGHP